MNAVCNLKATSVVVYLNGKPLLIDKGYILNACHQCLIVNANVFTHVIYIVKYMCDIYVQYILDNPETFVLHVGKLQSASGADQV